MKNLNSLHGSRGFTLVELLIALVLGLMLSAGIVNVYLENKRNYMQDEEVARLQENARYALGLLKREITMAGFFAGIGDYSDTDVGTVTDDCVSGNNWALNVQQDMFELINDVDNSNTTLATQNGTTWDCLTASELVDESDLLSSKRTADRRTLEDGALTVTTEADAHWYLRAADENADLSWVYVADGASIPAADKASGNAVDYWQYFNRIYYLRNYSRTAGDEIPTLCTESMGANAMETECLVEGIEDMQIEVGIDTNDDSVPDQFLSAPSAVQMQEAVVVRVYLLVRSVNALSGYTNEKEYNLGSKTILPKNDGFIRRVFSTTVQMRNAKLPNA